MSVETDEKLIEKYLAGDESALGELIRKYTPPIYNFSAQYFGYNQDAEDVVQEVFIKVWQNFKKFDIQKKFKPWLFSIARNTIIDFLRKKKRTNLAKFKVDELDDFFVNLPDLSKDELAKVLASENNLGLRDAVSALPAIYREILVLHYLNELSLVEVSKVLQVPFETLKSRLRRALLKLRNSLNKENFL